MEEKEVEEVKRGDMKEVKNMEEEVMAGREEVADGKEGKKEESDGGRM